MDQPGRLSRTINQAINTLYMAMARVRNTTRIRCGVVGLSRRLAVLATASDLMHVRLILDAIETFHPFSTVTLFLDEPVPNWNAPDLLAEYPRLAALDFIDPASSHPMSIDRFDILILLHPYPYATPESLRRVQRLRPLARRIPASRRFICFRDMELWDYSITSRVLRFHIHAILGLLSRWIHAHERHTLAKSVAPHLATAPARPIAEPCPHPHAFRIFDRPRAIDFCPDCGMGITPPGRALREDWIEETYGPTYVFMDRFIGWREWEQHCEAMCHRLEDVFSSLGFDAGDAPGNDAAPPPRVLDFGCGHGRYARLWSRKGWQYLGIDPSPHNLRRAQEDIARWHRDPWPKPRFHIGRLGDELIAQEAPFDVIFLCQVLEHIPDPKALLSQLRAYATTQGLLYVEVPHAGYYGWDPIQRGFTNCEHLWDFTPAMLAAILRQTGWQILRAADSSQPDKFPYHAILAQR